jgi:hypothetical protein
MLALAACGPDTREIRLVPAPGACAGVVLVRIVITGAAAGADIERTLHLDPGQANCDFGSAFTIDGIAAGAGRRVLLEGIDSAGQTVITGQSASFSDPPSQGVTTVAVSRSSLVRGTVLFVWPEIVPDTLAYIAVGTIKGNPNPTVVLASAEAAAWIASGASHRFAVTGLPENKYILAWGLDRDRNFLPAPNQCDLGMVEPGKVYLTASKSPAPCTVLRPTQ